jgi:cytochrome c oxidase assembly protein subunit 15
VALNPLPLGKRQWAGYSAGMTTKPPNHWLARALWALIATTYVLIVFGSAVRVTDSGMACPDWPLCYGQWLPFPAPEGGYVVQGVLYTWWQVLLEWGHRLLAAVVGFALLALIAVSIWQRPTTSRLLRWSWVPVVILALQIKLGGLTVFLSNIHWSVALHLGGATLVLGSLIWLARLLQPQLPPLPPAKLRFALLIFGGLVVTTMLVGAMISAGHYGAICGGLLVCLGQIWPDDFGQQFHMKHRYMALITLIFGVFLVLLTKRTAPEWRRPVLYIKGLLGLQVLLGVITLYSFSYYPQFYMLLSVGHLAVAVALAATTWATFLGLLGPKQ